MAWAKQAPAQGKRTATAARRAVMSLVVLAGVALSACSLGSKGVGEIDQGLMTSSMPPTPGPSASTEELSDQATIRNAVTSVDLMQAQGQPLAWANGGTGSRGAISGIVESSREGVKCRSFTTTRESFTGVSLYSGQACMVAPGAWQMTAFAPG